MSSFIMKGAACLMSTPFVIPKAIRWQVAKHCRGYFSYYGLERLKETFWIVQMINKYIKEYCCLY